MLSVGEVKQRFYLIVTQCDQISHNTKYCKNKYCTFILRDSPPYLLCASKLIYYSTGDIIFCMKRYHSTKAAEMGLAILLHDANISALIAYQSKAISPLYHTVKPV